MYLDWCLVYPRTKTELCIIHNTPTCWKLTCGCHLLCFLWRQLSRREDSLKQHPSVIILWNQKEMQLLTVKKNETLGSAINPEISGQWCKTQSMSIGYLHQVLVLAVSGAPTIDVTHEVNVGQHVFFVLTVAFHAQFKDFKSHCLVLQQKLD